jgi:hypothetical protein
MAHGGSWQREIKAGVMANRSAGGSEMAAWQRKLKEMAAINGGNVNVAQRESIEERNS